MKLLNEKMPEPKQINRVVVENRAEATFLFPLTGGQPRRDDGGNYGWTDGTKYQDRKNESGWLRVFSRIFPLLPFIIPRSIFQLLQLKIYDVILCLFSLISMILQCKKWWFLVKKHWYAFIYPFFNVFSAVAKQTLQLHIVFLKTPKVFHSRTTCPWMEHPDCQKKRAKQPRMIEILGHFPLWS